MRATPTAAKDYLRKEISKANRPQIDNLLNELIDYFSQINKQKHLKNMAKQVKDMVPKTMKSQRHTCTEHSEEIR